MAGRRLPPERRRNDSSDGVFGRVPVDGSRGQGAGAHRVPRSLASDVSVYSDSSESTTSWNSQAVGPPSGYSRSNASTSSRRTSRTWSTNSAAPPPSLSYSVCSPTVSSAASDGGDSVAFPPNYLPLDSEISPDTTVRRPHLGQHLEYRAPRHVCPFKVILCCPYESPSRPATQAHAEGHFVGVRLDRISSFRLPCSVAQCSLEISNDDDYNEAIKGFVDHMLTHRSEEYQSPGVCSKPSLLQLTDKLYRANYVPRSVVEGNRAVRRTR